MNRGNHPVNPGLSNGPRESVFAVLLGAFSRAGAGITALEEMEVSLALARGLQSGFALKA